MDLKTFTTTKSFTRVLFVLAGLVAVLAIFQAGIFVGYHKAAFAFGGGERYYQAFGDRRHGGMMSGGMMFDRGFSDAHGAAGKILKVTLPTFVMEGNDGVEQVVSIENDTEIRKWRDAVKPEDLRAGDMVVVIGKPNAEAGIAARLIRLLPPPPETLFGTTTLPRA